MQWTGYAAQVGDCNDQNDLVNPGANEVCNLIDDNCDGIADENTAIDASVWYLDDDADGYGDTTSTITQCSHNHILLDGDCDDANASVNPSEGCDGVDYNCDGQIDNDIDLDGFSDVSCGGDDCNDSDLAGDCILPTAMRSPPDIQPGTVYTPSIWMDRTMGILPSMFNAT